MKGAAKSPNIQHSVFTLHNSPLSGEMLANAAKKISESTVSAVDLAYNRLGQRDINLQPLLDALKCQSAFESLSIANNELGGRQLQGVFDFVSQSSTLKSLSLANNPLGNLGATKLATALTNNQTLKKVNLSSTNIDNTGLEQLLAAIKDHPTLTHINLNSCLAIHAGVLSAKVQSLLKDICLQKNTLLELKIAKNRINKKVFKEIFVDLPDHLLSLDLSHNPIGPDAFNQWLKSTAKNNLSLAQLDIANTELQKNTDWELVAQKFTNLSFLNMSDNHWQAKPLNQFFEAFKKHRCLSELVLHGKRIDTEGFVYLCDFLRQNPPVKKLNFLGGKIEAKAAVAVYHFMVHNFGLQDLNLNDTPAHPAIVEHFIAGLKFNPALVTLKGIALSGPLMLQSKKLIRRNRALWQGRADELSTRHPLKNLKLARKRAGITTDLSHKIWEPII